MLALWGILSVGALAQFLHDSAAASDQWARSETEVLLAWQLLILNFPVSLLLMLVPGVVDIPRGPVGEWCAMTLLGFIQWGVLIPALVRKLRRLADRLRGTPARGSG